MRIPLNDSVSTFNHPKWWRNLWKNILKPIWSYEQESDCTKLRPSLDAYTEALETEWTHRKLISMNQSYNNQALTTRLGNQYICFTYNAQANSWASPATAAANPTSTLNRSNCAKESGNTALLKSLGKLSEAAMGEDLNMAQRILGEMRHCSAWCRLQEISNKKCENRTEWMQRRSLA